CEVGESGHEVPHVRPASGGVHPEEHLVVPGRRIVEVAELEDVRRPVSLALCDRLHDSPPLPLVYGVHLVRGTVGVRRTLCQARMTRRGKVVRQGGRMAQEIDLEAPRREALSRERVLQAAVALADESGVDSLSMRKLAGRLGVVPMALYKHVANKDE